MMMSKKSKSVIGCCWVKRDAKEKCKQESIQNVISTGKRKIFIPSKKAVSSNYIECSELIDYLVQSIEAAQDLICMSSFLIQKSQLTGALLKAAERGVKVFLLTGREDDLKKQSDELDSYNKKVIDQHKDLLNSFAGKILVRTSDNFHAKYLIIDPHSPDPFGLIMTCNATVGPMTGNNIEVALTLTKDETESLFSHFLNGFWKMANYELIEKGKLNPVNEETNLNIDFGEITYFSTCKSVNSLKDQILKLIEGASKSIILTAWSFDDDCGVLKAVKDAVDRGVSVHIYARIYHDYKNAKALLPLILKVSDLKSDHINLNILGHRRFHAKSIIVDDNRGLITTSNFTKRGLDRGFEASVMLDEHEISIFKNILSYWDSLCDWKLEHICQFCKIQNCHLDYESYDLCKHYSDFLKPSHFKQDS